MSVPSSRVPLKTSPNPPEPSRFSLEKLFVAFLSSFPEKILADFPPLLAFKMCSLCFTSVFRAAFFMYSRCLYTRNAVNTRSKNTPVVAAQSCRIPVAPLLAETPLPATIRRIWRALGERQLTTV